MDYPHAFDYAPESFTEEAHPVIVQPSRQREQNGWGSRYSGLAIG
jgi:hypothetical protein